MHPRRYLFYLLPDEHLLIRGLDLEDDRLLLRTFDKHENELLGSEELVIPAGLRGMEYINLWLEHHRLDGWVESRKNLDMFPVMDVEDPSSLLSLVQFGYPRMSRPKKTPNRVLRVPSTAVWVTFLWNPLTKKLHTNVRLEGDKARLAQLANELRQEFAELDVTVVRGWWFEGTFYLLEVLWEDGEDTFFLTDWEDRTWASVKGDDPYDCVVNVFSDPFLVENASNVVWEEMGFFTYQCAEGTAYSPVGVRAKPLRGVVWLPEPMTSP